LTACPNSIHYEQLLQSSPASTQSFRPGSRQRPSRPCIPGPSRLVANSDAGQGYGPPHLLSSSALLVQTRANLSPSLTMEASGPSSLKRGSPKARPADGTVRQRNDDDLEGYMILDDSRSYNNSSTFAKPGYNDQTTTINTGADCDRRRPEEGDHPRMVNMSSSLISETVTPFLREHIPSNYAPISKVDSDDTSLSKDPNSKFCYRHRPGTKCRKAADENKMVMIQRVRLKIPPRIPCVRTMLTLSFTGTRPVICCRPTGHHTCVVSFQRRSIETPRAYAQRRATDRMLPPALRRQS
jgi:hypothetical protein